MIGSFNEIYLSNDEIMYAREFGVCVCVWGCGSVIKYGYDVIWVTK